MRLVYLTNDINRINFLMFGYAVINIMIKRKIPHTKNHKRKKLFIANKIIRYVALITIII